MLQHEALQTPENSPRMAEASERGLGREFGFWLARGVVHRRRLAGRPLVPGRALEGRQ